MLKKIIINSVGLKFDPEIEILEFGEMVGATVTVEEEKEPEPVEQNSFEFSVQALSILEGEAFGQLSPEGQSPAPLGTSSDPIIEINAEKTALIQESHYNWSKLPDESPSTLNGPSGLLIGERYNDDSTISELRDESPSTLNGPPGLLIGERYDDDSLTSMMVNAIDVDNTIIGTNSRFTNRETQTSRRSVKTTAKLETHKIPHLFGG